LAVQRRVYLVVPEGLAPQITYAFPEGLRILNRGLRDAICTNASSVVAGLAFTSALSLEADELGAVLSEFGG